MIQTVTSGRPLTGRVRPPSDKSISHRAALFAALASGTSRITDYSPSQDCASTLACLRSLGVQVRQDENTVVIDGVGGGSFVEPAAPLDCGNSGTTMRLLLGVLAGMDLQAVLVGDDSLTRRPMDRVLRPLGNMGIRYDGRTHGKFPPIYIRGGGLQGIAYTTPVASAQVKSALLIAGLRAGGETTVTEPALSRDHTEKMLRAMGADLRIKGLSVTVRPSMLQAVEQTIPGDPSAAAFLLGAAVVTPGSDVTVLGVGMNRTRTGFLSVLRRMGAYVSIENEREESGEPVADVRARHSALEATEIHGSEIPTLIDELPLLAAVATQAQGDTTIRNAAELRLKETDRIAVLHEMLTLMGARVEELPDGLTVRGPTRLMGATVNPRHDHRIAMALSVAGLTAGGQTSILNAECTAVSYPDYWRDLAILLGKGGP